MTTDRKTPRPRTNSRTFPLNLRGTRPEVYHVWSKWIEAEEQNLRRMAKGNVPANIIAQFHEAAHRVCMGLTKKTTKV